MKLIARLSSQHGGVDAFTNSGKKLVDLGEKSGVAHCAQRELSIQPRKGVFAFFRFKKCVCGKVLCTYSTKDEGLFSGCEKTFAISQLTDSSKSVISRVD